MLDVERAFYAEKVEEWKRLYPGKVVVVKERRLLGAYQTIEEALAAGAAEFGLQSFLVRPVGEGEREVSIPALTLGLLGAHPTHSAKQPGAGA